MIRSLLRVPGLRLAPELASDDDVITGYLTAFDAALLGSARIRQRDVVEMKDHLESQRSLLESRGLSRAEAAQQAVASMAPPATLAASQRQRLWQRFALSCVGVALLFWTILAMFDVLEGQRWTDHVMSHARFTLLTTLAIAWSLTFVYALRAAPRALDPARPFRVTFPRSYRLIGIVAGLVGVGQLVAVASSLFPAGASYSLPTAIVLTLLALVLIGIGVVIGSRAFEVDADGFHIVSLLGRQRVAWTDVVTSAPLTRARWLPLGWYWRSVRVVTFRAGAGDGRRRELTVWPDMDNSDVFADRLRHHAA